MSYVSLSMDHPIKGIPVCSTEALLPTCRATGPTLFRGTDNYARTTWRSELIFLLSCYIFLFPLLLLLLWTLLYASAGVGEKWISPRPDYFRVISQERTTVYTHIYCIYITAERPTAGMIDLSRMIDVVSTKAIPDFRLSAAPGTTEHTRVCVPNGTLRFLSPRRRWLFYYRPNWPTGTCAGDNTYIIYYIVYTT